MNRYNAQLSAEILKKYGYILSDEDMKVIHESNDKKLLAEEIMRRGGPFTPRDVEILNEVAGWEDDGSELNDEILDKYAQHIFNYEYTYKTEAKSVDPQIDTEEEHIGPMAQDIEQVNPACVKEVNGYKTVDTGRLALMNAGAIAALAREVQELKHE